MCLINVELRLYILNAYPSYPIIKSLNFTPATIELQIKLIFRGSVAQWLAYLLPDPGALGSIPSFPDIVSEEKIAEFN